MVRQMTYQPPRAAPAPVEAMSFARLRALNDGGTQRADFHVLAFVRRGRASVSVDFTSYALEKGTVAWIRPGAVHRWTDIADVAGDLVLFVPTAPLTPAAQALVTHPTASAPWTVAPAARRALAHLRFEHRSATADDPRTPELLRLLLTALLLRLDPRTTDDTPRDGTVHRFRHAVEHDFHTHHDVGHYARQLGYSERTLTRRTSAAIGCTAKEYITERLLLEAKRLLVHDGLSPASCGRRLGFPDASNFSAFFLRGTGTRPGAWQVANGGAVGGQLGGL